MILSYRCSSFNSHGIRYERGEKNRLLYIVCKSMASLIRSESDVKLLSVSFAKNITSNQQRLELFATTRSGYAINSIFFQNIALSYELYKCPQLHIRVPLVVEVWHRDRQLSQNTLIGTAKLTLSLVTCADRTRIMVTICCSQNTILLWLSVHVVGLFWGLLLSSCFWVPVTCTLYVGLTQFGQSYMLNCLMWVIT